MNARQLVEELMAMLNDDTALSEAGSPLEGSIRSTEDFQSAGVLTHDDGFVLKLRNGRKFHVTVQEDRR